MTSLTELARLAGLTLDEYMEAYARYESELMTTLNKAIESGYMIVSLKEKEGEA